MDNIMNDQYIYIYIYIYNVYWIDNVYDQCTVLSNALLSAE